MRLISYTEENLVKRHRGTMPIILTCPHGGIDQPANVDVREKDQTPNEPGCGFKTLRDRETAVIAEGVAQKIFNVTGHSPYVVIARYHRRFIDANRPENCAFTDVDAVPFYREYHNRIDEYVDEILSQNQARGFLFDIHGTVVEDESQHDIFLGTDDGKSLVSPYSKGNIFMQHGMHGLLKSYQYDISPIDEAAPEEPALSGGFTVKRYGVRINCIQIEISNFIRLDPGNRDLFIEDFSFAAINSARVFTPF
jgi:N-formylglutamate amidohydrolase